MSDFDLHEDRPARYAGGPLPPLVSALPPSAAAAAIRVSPARISLSAARLALSTRLRRGCSSVLPEQGGELALQMAGKAAQDWSGSLALTGEFGTIEIADAVRLLRALGGIDLDGERDADDERWEWLQSCVLAHLAGTPFAAVEHIGRSAAEHEDTCVLRLSMRNRDHSFVTHARTSAASWLQFMQGGTWRRERGALSGYLGLPYLGTVRIARHSLPVHALETLAAGDIIVPNSPDFGFPGGGMLEWETLSARVRFISPCALKFEYVEKKMDTLDMNSEDPHAVHGTAGDAAFTTEGPGSGGEDCKAAGSQDDAELDSVAVTLEFELGKVRMTLGELRTLAENTIVPLHGGSPHSVSIICGGRRLGRGETVAVNNQLAIRILEWSVK